MTTATPTMKAGWSKIDITPPDSTDMGGFWARPGPSIGTHDALRGSVLLFEAHQHRVGVISLDLVGLDAQRADDLRVAMSRAIGNQPEDLLLCFTHTHSGPLSLSFRGMGQMPGDYLDGLTAPLVKAIEAAADRLQPCRLSTTSVDVDLAINRRAHWPGELADGSDPATLVPRQAHALQVETDQARAVLIHYACHPVVLGGANRLISADYPGVSVTHVEATAGAELAIFVNGACGDLNPPRGDGDFSDVEAAGLAVGEAIVSGLQTAASLPGDTVGAVFERVDLPLMEPPSTLRTAARASIDGLKLAIKSAFNSDDLSQRRVPEARLAWARDLLALDQAAPRIQPFALHGIRIGDLRLVGMEGEIFCRYQIDLEADHDLAWLCGYADGCVGYIPTADEYARGGYEIDDAFTVYPSVLMVAPASEVILRSAMGDILDRLRTGSRATPSQGTSGQ
ncbi:MAG: hypothetical protein HN712_10405 [Gemmatimonadetes bacterium]|jgi:neutral ceramidase|nr:hypothetical protein [Gemmatimonadota bacterium]MBT6144299.1 hypothetical protein [Gemmatimonadota bacterium]MBT7860715.1 hypothetical protein [Gemmatimonadota bacterium]